MARNIAKWWWFLLLVSIFGVSTFAQQKTIKDPAEFNMYVSAIPACSTGSSEPVQTATALERFVQRFPNSVMNEEALELLMATYAQMHEPAKLEATADRLLLAHPNNLPALAVLTYSKRARAKDGQYPDKNNAEARKLAKHGLEASGSAPTSIGLSDADWATLKLHAAAVFNGSRSASHDVDEIIAVLWRSHCSKPIVEERGLFRNKRP